MRQKHKVQLANFDMAGFAWYLVSLGPLMGCRHIEMSRVGYPVDRAMTKTRHSLKRGKCTMVNIPRHLSASPVVDEQAMQTFRHQWQVYSKLVDNDYLSHQAVRAVLNRELATDVNRPFRFLDLACGDARLTVAALQGTL